MPIPTNRLILLALGGLAPLLALVGYVVPGSAGMAAVLILAGAPLLVDALTARRLAGGLKLALDPPAHATQGRPLEITARLEGGRGVRLALAAPDSWEDADGILAAPPGPGARTVTWPVLPRQRGRFRITAVHAECLSPLGLWGVRRTLLPDGTTRVFPDLRDERGVLAPLFLRKAALGIHRTRTLGKGREFEQLRDYAPGDSYEDISWKATARRLRPVTKVHMVERSQDVYVVVDASRRSRRRLTKVESGGGPPPLQVDRFVRAALALTLTALQQGDRPGIATFGRSLDRFIRAGGGQPHYAACRDALFDLEAVPHPPDFADLFAGLRNRIRHRSLVIFLTNLDDPVLAAEFVDEVTLLSRQHIVLVGQLAAPGTVPLFRRHDTPATDEAVYARLAGHLLWEGTRETRAQLRARGVHGIHAPAEGLVADMVSAYLDIKRRQLV